MPFKKGKYRQQGKGKLGRYHATRRCTSVVRTATTAASSASAAVDGVGDDRGGSGASGAVVADVKRRGRRKRAKHYHKGYPEKSPDFVPYPDCAAAVAKRNAVWARWLAQ